MYIDRALEPIVQRYSEHFKVVVVTGPRQVGKATMLRHLAEQDETRGIARSYVSLDNTALRLAAKEDPELFLQRYRPPVLIDEIQKAPELLPYIKLFADVSDEPGRYWLTGSQPLHLMREVSESLAGRAGIIEMLGLSNAEIAGRTSMPFDPSPEYFTGRVVDMPSYDVREAYRRIAAGSLPAIRALPDDLHAGGYDSYIDTYVMRDIRDLAHIGDELKFPRFMAGCAAFTSKPVVYAELARIADIDEKTAKTWLSLLASSYLVKIAQPYSNSLLKRLSKQPIMHFTDTGLAAHLSGWRSAESLEFGAMGGQVFETFAFGEVYKGYLNTGLRPPLTFFRNNDKKEIDLLLEKDGRLHPVEVEKTASPNRKDIRNFSAIDPVSAEDAPSDLLALKREIGMGAVLCMASDAYPIGREPGHSPSGRSEGPELHCGKRKSRCLAIENSTTPSGFRSLGSKKASRYGWPEAPGSPGRIRTYNPPVNSRM